MLKKLNLTLVVMLIFGLFAMNSYAQTSDQTKTKKTPEQKAEKMAKKLQEKLSLSDAQYKSVYDLALTHINQRASLKSLDKESRKTEMKKMREDHESQLKSILSADQWTKWEGLKKEMKEKHKDHKKDGKGKNKMKSKEKPVK
ncbi:MAG: hypothetical protein JST55_14455 [Bacteroidetes bacterium]|nr:hypothetical protein [Bacteroidota bacterium]